MRPRRVVVQPPGFDEGAGFGKRCEVILVEAFVTKLAVETLDEGILRGFAGSDVVQPNAAIDGPAQHGQACEFGAVVQNDRFGIAADRGDGVEHTDDAFAAERGIDLDCQGLMGEIVDDRQSSNAAFGLQSIVNEVQRPPLVHRGDERRGIATAESDAPANAPPYLQIGLAINPADPFEIHHNSLTAQQHRQPAVSEAPTFGSELFQSFAQRTIVRDADALVAEHSSITLGDATGMTLADRDLLAHSPHRSTALRGR